MLQLLDRMHFQVYLKNKSLISKKKISFVRQGYKIYALGVSNLVDTNVRRYGLQFYDLDKHTEDEDDMGLIRQLFKGKDCLIYESKHGFHFISFMMDRKFKRPRQKANDLSEKIGEVYNFKKKDYLILRISPKMKRNKILSGRPKFYRMLNEPVLNSNVSSGHLKLYAKRVGIPDNILNLYLERCNIIQTKCCVHIYRTRD